MKVLMSRVSCLVIAFSRLEGVERLLNSINPSEIESLYVAIDGPTSDEIRTTQVQIVNMVDSYCAKNSIRLVVWQRDENLGVAAAIISAIDWFFAREDFGIVLEDDLIVGEDFVSFVLGNMHHLENDEVLLISGDQFDQQRQLAASGNWTNYPLIWGWASWREKWNEIEEYILLNHLNPHSSLPLNVIKFWQLGNWRAQKGILDSWAVPLAANMRLRNKYCLLPPVNLVSNRGVGEGAVHTTENAWHTNWKISNDLELTDFRSQWSKPKNNLIIEDSNHYLEENIYQIKPRHIFSTYISIFLDQIKRRSKRSSLFDELNKNANVQYF